MAMASVRDVATYILRARGSMSAMKLQKLVYYSQAWHLVWEERPLFPDPVEAWANGPVVPSLYQQHRGKFIVGQGDFSGDPTVLSEDERSSIDAVLRFYGDKSAHWLSELSHRERPWAEAREAAGLGPGERGGAVIPQASMAEFYDGLTNTESTTV
ncbi:MAG: Panacea domain-containing protein [Mycobacteriales bacterium]